ncbi:MAG: hypothetical protein JNL65_01835 [Saprospiraceae bacterium]|nr:hypothetical protein [Saprospiraceae bacterium]HRG69810.1 hypothetical protein [Saprospiraceae bacterium]
MLELFKRNTFMGVLLLIPYAMVLHASSWFNNASCPVSDACWLFLKLFKGLSENAGFNITGSLILIVLQALWIGRMVSRFKLTGEGQLFGSLFFILFCGFHYSTLCFGPVLLANFFFTLALPELFGIYLKKKPALSLFNYGFLVGLASIFYPPYCVFLILGLVAILVMRVYQLKEILQILGGFFNVWFLLFVCLYSLNLHTEFWEVQMGGFFKPFIFSMKFGSQGWIAFSLLFIFILLNLIQYPFFQFKRSIMAQKQFDLLFWTLLICGFSILFLQIDQVNHLIILFSPLALLTGVLLTKPKNPLLQETIHLFLLLSSLFLQFQNW